jgi:hypothetical protein
MQKSVKAASAAWSATKRGAQVLYPMERGRPRPCGSSPQGACL